MSYHTKMLVLGIALWVSVECQTSAPNSSVNVSCKEIAINATEPTLLPGPRLRMALMTILVIALLLLPSLFYYICCILFDCETSTSQKAYNSTSRVEKKNAIFVNPLGVQPLGKEDVSIVQDNDIFCNVDNYQDPEVMHYSIIMRIGCPSFLFDMQNGWIEFILVDQNHNDVNVSFRLVALFMNNISC